MTCAFVPPPTATAAPAWLVVDAARCWREARDRGHAVLPILFARLEIRRAGFITPAIDALLATHESWSGRRFCAGHAATHELTDDEHEILGLLGGGLPLRADRAARPSLTAVMQVALRSTRIILRAIVGPGLPAPAAPHDAPIFFVPTEEHAPDPVRATTHSVRVSWEP